MLNIDEYSLAVNLLIFAVVACAVWIGGTKGDFSTVWTLFTGLFLMGSSNVQNAHCGVWGWIQRRFLSFIPVTWFCFIP